MIDDITTCDEHGHWDVWEIKLLCDYRDRLKAALSRYGHHDGDCEWALTDGALCNCGLLSLVRGEEPQPAEHK